MGGVFGNFKGEWVMKIVVRMVDKTPFEIVPIILKMIGENPNPPRLKIWNKCPKPYEILYLLTEEKYKEGYNILQPEQLYDVIMTEISNDNVTLTFKFIYNQNHWIMEVTGEGKSREFHKSIIGKIGEKILCNPCGELLETPMEFIDDDGNQHQNLYVKPFRFL